MKIQIEVPGEDATHPEAIQNALAFIHNMVHIYGPSHLAPYVTIIEDNDEA